MVCPVCHSAAARRSRRRSLWDFALSCVGLVPWRCGECEKRFHARTVQLRNVRYARCRICGNLDLQKIAPDYVAGPMAVLARMLGLPALRCDPCRHKFFALRPVMRETPRLTSSSSTRAA